ncbi:arylesterase [Lutibaculum baratangense]|uniref:arylesterase n=1 Tax=Lutibaculum baratangense TaxID=1358440 RepID=UPI001FCC1829|nr:arylesterase [Lutibaculum baratangense]
MAFIAFSRPAAAEAVDIVAFGDSLTAGYGLAQNESFPAQLEAALREKGHDVTIRNAGVSGDTTAAGLERLDWAVPEDVDGVIVELGANDMLRGLDPARTRENLDEILTRLTDRDLPILLAGMFAAPNLGQDYGRRFNAIFPELAEEHDTLLYPFFMDGVALNDSLIQDDGLHPTADGVAVIVERILPTVEEFIARIEAARAD